MRAALPVRTPIIDQTTPIHPSTATHADTDRDHAPAARGPHEARPRRHLDTRRRRQRHALAHQPLALPNPEAPVRVVAHRPRLPVLRDEDGMLRSRCGNC